MTIWKRIYGDYGYKVIADDESSYDLSSYTGKTITDKQGIIHNVETEIIKDNEFIIVIT